jgi:hypothetical protein
VQLVERWNRVESDLDPRWTEARLSLAIYDDAARSRAAALLGPAGPGIMGQEIRFSVTRSGRGIGSEAARRLLRRIDDEGVVGRLELVSESEAEAPPTRTSRPLLADEWQAVLEALPSDWSDLVLELGLDSSADVNRAAVLCAPLNPIQTSPEASGRPGFHFRSASAHGYGASAGMIARCLTRLDEEEITGHLRIARVLSDVHPVGTQGAVFLTGLRPA